ncbi:ExbD/TolR family protein [Thiocystis violacea]|uniref:ExbD/TolR family protein n=1 Tax=Thiocystis violacea TaxID=13725 RepID=UPI00190342D3|nr:biopolymer transporter ExbD [Thiocystis violacea]MBK1720753.1 biopolymer transporter ExbD [Thiocystis violacea]
MRRRKHHFREEDTGLDMTPMLDIVFIMLIFFIVTSSFVKESGVDVSRPAAMTAARKEHGNLMVAITRDNAIWIDRHQVEIGAVRASLERLHAENPEGGVVIQADKASASGLLVQVIDQARRAGIEEVSIAAELIHQ